MMATLRNSSPKLLSHNYCMNSETRFTTNIHTHSLCKPQIRTLLLPFKHLDLRFSPSVSPPLKTTHLISPISSLSSPHQQTDTKNEGPEIEDIDQSKTVRVKFQLKRECSFGQQFFVVGDDPTIGSWNPSNALQLNWSDGHIWNVELDVPIGISIKFKFLLKGNTEEDILWQPGPDRILQTWETDRMICVSEDWDDADLQKLLEEELSCNTKDTSMETLAENLTQPIRSQTDNVEEEEEFGFGMNGRAMNVKILESEKTEGIIESYEGVLPVLVPGLTPLPIVSTDEEEFNSEVEKTFGTRDSSNGAEEAKAINVPEIEVAGTHSKKSPEMVVVDKQEPSQNEEAEKMRLAEEQEETSNGVLENDIQWGRQTLQKLLSNFGIL